MFYFLCYSVFQSPLQVVANAAPLIKRMNAPEPSRVKDLSNLIVPEELDKLMCIECGDSLNLDKHKLVDISCFVGTVCLIDKHMGGGNLTIRKSIMLFNEHLNHLALIIYCFITF